MRGEKNKNKNKNKKNKEKDNASSWSRLPSEISRSILFLLPIHQALKASSVCKQWRSTLIPRLPLLRSPSSSNPLHVLSDHLLPILRPSSRNLSWFCYHRLSHKWLWVPGLTFLPPSFRPRSVLASRRGLLLLQSFQNELLVCNLSTQDFALLPPLRNAHYYRRSRAYAASFHLHVDPDGSAYSILVIPDMWSPTAYTNVRSHEPVPNSSVFVRFRSRCGLWETLRHECPDASQLRQSSWPYIVPFSVVDVYVAVDDCIFVLVTPSYTPHAQLLRCTFPSSSWSFVCQIPLKATSIKIVAVLQTLFFVELDEASLEFQIYKLQMPDLLLEVPETRIDSGFGGFTDSWYASASSSSWPPCIYVGRRERANGVLEYNVMTNSWTQLLLPHFVDYGEGDNTASCVCADGYELGLNTSVFYEGMESDENENESFGHV